jgi:methylmalonyl-CoA epimerase
MLSGIDHVGVVVDDIEAMIAVYQETLSMPLVHRETLPEQGVDAALLDVGESHVELITPLDPDSSVGRFLAKRGSGLHHVAYRVQNVERALDRLAASGVRLIDESPRIGIRGSKVAFVHPSSTAGVLTELVEPAGQEHDER